MQKIQRFTRRGILGATVGALSVGVACTSEAAKGCGEGFTRVKGKCVPMTPTPSPTETPISTVTNTPTDIPLPTSTPTDFPTSTLEPTVTDTSVPSSTPSSTPTGTPTNTVTPTATPTETPTKTPTPDTGNWVDHGPIDPIAGVKTTWGKTISNLVPFNGEIFLGYGDYTENQPARCRLLGWKDGIIDHGEIPSVALLDNIVSNGQLVIPFTDLSSGTYPTAAYLNADGSIEVIGGGYTPRAWHVFGAAYFNGQRYLCGSSFVTATTDQQAVWREDIVNGNPKWINPTPDGYIPNSFAGGSGRVYGIFVYNGALYHSDSGTMYKTTDGARWTVVGSAPFRLRKPSLFGGSMFFTSGNAGLDVGNMYKFSGASAVRVGPIVWDYTIGQDGNMYALTNTGKIVDGTFKEIDVAPPNARSIAQADGKMYIGTSDSHLFSKKT